MADNPRMRDGRYRSRVSKQPWEISHVAKKLNVSVQAVTGAKRAVGTSRDRVEAFIRDRKKGGYYD